MKNEWKIYWYLEYHKIGNENSTHTVCEFPTLAELNEFLETHINTIDKVYDAEYREKLIIKPKQFVVCF